MDTMKREYRTNAGETRSKYVVETDGETVIITQTYPGIPKTTTSIDIGLDLLKEMMNDIRDYRDTQPIGGPEQ